MRIPPLLCCAAALLTPLAASASAAPPISKLAPAIGSAGAAAAEFVAAFNALDRSRFDPLFADDVTLFFPSAPFEVRRVDGKEAVLKWFGKFFDAARARGGKLNIQPMDLRVQDYGTAAIVTFHLDGGDDVGRRTLVLHKQGGAWRIVHLHASSQPLKKKPAKEPSDSSGARP